MRARTERRLRRDVARRAGCEAGGQALVFCAYCGHPISIDWHDAEPRFEAVIWIDVLQPDGSRRVWVERTHEAAHLDHVIPEWRNGPTSPDNTVIACAPCNLAKGGSAFGDLGFLDWLVGRRDELGKRLVAQRVGVSP